MSKKREHIAKQNIEEELTNSSFFSISPYGDQAVRWQFGKQICLEVNQRVRKFALLLEREQIPGVVEWVPAYTTLTLFYNPYQITYAQLEERLLALQAKENRIQLPPSKVIHIPTCYGGEKGPDLTYVAQFHQLSEEEVIALHSQRDYLIYMLGFIPGFPYLGGLSSKIATPRLANPRAQVAAGSVGIAGEQTGIYPLATPGGWQLIGRTPLVLYDPLREQPMLLQAGDYLRFQPVSEEEYLEIEREIKGSDN